VTAATKGRVAMFAACFSLWVTTRQVVPRLEQLELSICLAEMNTTCISVKIILLSLFELLPETLNNSEVN
jgi:hypothetical protein